MIQDIPKLYTALAEWLACVLFVRLLPQRYNAAKTAGILAAALPLFGLVQWLIGIVPLSLWIPGMIVALVLMYATIWLCCRLNFCDTGFWWALAFTLAEFVASLEWQLYSFGASKMPGRWWIQGLFLLAFYGGGFGVFLRLEQKRLRDKAPLHMTRRESISAAVIAICTFLISNISYVTTNTPFSGRMTTEIFWIRTLVDFAGMAVLLSMQDRWQDMQTQHELTAIQTLLKRQYEQYRISRDNSEAINRKYHDLKHQIQVIRMESDAARREEYLSQLEKGMQSLGVNQHTGNDVLDTILSDKQLYCSQHQITLTIVADGARLDFIETMDICSIFGNALDNAIEGVEKLADPQQRLIRVAVYTQNVFLIIRVENYCTAQLSVVDGEYRTTKHDKDMHGYGIKSIRYTAEKYGGSVSADCSDNWFHLSVLLPLPRHIANGLASAFHKNVLAIQQIPIYIIRHLVAVTIKQLFGGGTCRNTETDNYAVNVRLYFSLAVPAECAIGKINMHTGVKQRLPKVGNTLPLRYRICRNQRRANRCSLHNIGSLFIPATDIIQVSGVFPLGENGIYIGFLLFAHKPRPNKRRISHNVI